MERADHASPSEKEGRGLFLDMAKKGEVGDEGAAGRYHVDGEGPFFLEVLLLRQGLPAPKGGGKEKASFLWGKGRFLAGKGSGGTGRSFAEGERGGDRRRPPAGIPSASGGGGKASMRKGDGTRRGFTGER